MTNTPVNLVAQQSSGSGGDFKNQNSVEEATGALLSQKSSDG
jgi:hypothetical protein